MTRNYWRRVNAAAFLKYKWKKMFHLFYFYSVIINHKSARAINLSFISREPLTCLEVSCRWRLQRWVEI